jgi:hypothetical protein
MIKAINNIICPKIQGADKILSVLARALFTASLFLYFWASGLTKLGDGAIGFLFPAAAHMFRFCLRQWRWSVMTQANSPFGSIRWC